MDINFYLDDYYTICSNIHESLLRGDLHLYKNNQEINYYLECNDNLIYLKFNERYNEGDNYKIIHNDNTYNVSPRFIVHTKEFEDEYQTDINNLGSFYTKDSTLFRIWAPLNEEVYLVIDNEHLLMNYQGKGLYELEVKGDLAKKKYRYELVRDHKFYETRDPFAYVNAKDSNDSYVVDLSSFNFKNVELVPCGDPIIYELSVKDFSSDENAPFKYKGKFKAFSEELQLNGKDIGINYLANLGVSHIQLLPVLNFDLDGSDYNWGYNPIDFNSFYWGYVDGQDAYAPIEEFRALVDALHSKGLRVNLDVVYNHMYKYANNAFEKILPFYLFRYYKDGNYANGTYCGNEIRSNAYMVKEYLKLMNERLIKLYDIDGLRFDLMGILDSETINYLYASAKSLKPDFMFYGEGWDMGECVASDKKAALTNANKMPGVAFFNPYYRDTLKGPFNEKYSKGFILNNRDFDKELIDGLIGSYPQGLNYDQSLNYLECHDNMTVYDKVSLFNYKEDELKAICKMGLALIIMARGIPFIHAGQEFLRTKQGNENSYNLSTEINKIDWLRMLEFEDVVDYFKLLIRIRRENPIFRIDSKCKDGDYYGIIVYSIDNLDLIINPCDYNYNYASWIEYQEVYLANGLIINKAKSFDVNKHSIVIAKK